MILLRVIAVSAGAVDYLIRGSGCCERDHGNDHATDHAREQVAEPAREWAGGNGGERQGAARYFGAAVEHGEPAGRWGGRGLGLFGIEAGALASEGFVRSVFGRLQDPYTGESLGQAPRKYKNAEARVAAAVAAAGPDVTPEQRRAVELAAAADARKAVAYYDFTFSPVKSVSVYYAALLAAGEYEAAAQVAAAHERAVETAMAYAEEHVAYTRTGYHGRSAEGRSVGRYAAGEGLIWTAWRHSTNRENEPQLHTHVAVLNRLRTIADGVIRALDGRGIRPVKEAIATAYERALEEELVAARGVVFADRPDGLAREIVGIDPALCAEASTRRAQTLAKAEELTALYVARNGREPDAAARKAILHDAAMATRNPKGDAAAGPAAVAGWGLRDPERAARLVAAVEAVADAGEAAANAGHPDVVAGRRLDPAVPGQRAALLAAAVVDVQHQYATWTVGNLIAAIDRRVGPLPDRAGGRSRPAYLETLAREALQPGNPHGVVLLSAQDPVAMPEQLRRPQDGRSVFRPHIDERYATVGQLRTEERLVVGARQLSAPALGGGELELARVELAAAGLSSDQVEAVAGICSSGRAGDVLIGPAGTGKSRTVAALAQLWGERFGGRVLGLATSQIAAQVLAEDGVAALNTSRFLQAFTPGPDGEPARERVRPGDLFIVDEAGMAGTAELAAVAEIVAAGGGKLLYTGDTAQLTAVGSGGILELLVTDNGAHQLAEVHRFSHRWERAASLRLRAGDTSVIGEYEDRGRLHGGTREQMQTAAIRGWLADTLEGKQALLIVGRNEQAADLAQTIRRQLISYGRVSPEVLCELGQRAGRTKVSVGDVVQARRNEPDIRVDAGPDGAARRVTNRAVYTVLGRDPDGALRVCGPAGEVAHLPPGYVAEHLTLGYASTVHAAQGRTVDTSHALLDEAAAREAAYVALSRGREANTAYLVAQRAPDAHDPERLEQTAGGRLAAVLGNIEARPAAEIARRAGEREAASLAWIGGQWDDLARESARTRYQAALAELLPQDQLEVLRAEPGWPRLLRAVREAELAGHHPEALLEAAIAGRPLADADQVSDVLRWRVRVLARDRSPEQHVAPGDWTALAPPTDGPVGQVVHELAVLAGDRQHHLGYTMAADPPGWALEQLGPLPEEAQQRAEWVRRAGAVAGYRELAGLGPDTVSIGAAPSREQEFHRQLWAQAAAALGQHTDPGAVDYRTMADLDLYAVRDRWAREQAWAPAYVADEMRAAYQLGRAYTEDAALAGARLATLEPTDPDWDQTADQLARSQRLAELQLERARQLEEVHQARGGWYAATEDARVADEAARAELTRRGLPAQRELVTSEQLPLFDTPAPAAELAARGGEPAIEAIDERAAAVRRDEAAVGPAHEHEHDVAEPTAVEPRRLEPEGAEVDDVGLEEQNAAPEPTTREDDLQQDREPAPVEPVDEHELRVTRDVVEQGEQLRLLDPEPALADEVGAEPLHPSGEPEDGLADAGDERAEHTAATLAEARRQAEAAEQQRLTREAVAAASAAVAEAQQRMAALHAELEADRVRRDEAERQEQLIRWHEQDRAAEQDRGVDDGLGIDY